MATSIWNLWSKSLANFQIHITTSFQVHILFWFVFWFIGINSYAICHFLKEDMLSCFVWNSIHHIYALFDHPPSIFWPKFSIINWKSEKIYIFLSENMELNFNLTRTLSWDMLVLQVWMPTTTWCLNFILTNALSLEDGFFFFSLEIILKKMKN